MVIKNRAILMVAAGAAMVLGSSTVSIAGPAKTTVLNPYTLAPTPVTVPVVVTPAIVLVPVSPASISGLAPPKGSGTTTTGLPTLPPPMGGGSPPPPAPPKVN